MILELSEAREQLDILDAKIVKLLAERMHLIPEVAKYKKNNGVAIKQEDREKQIFESKRELARKNDLCEELVVDIYKRIIDEALRMEHKIINEEKD